MPGFPEGEGVKVTRVYFTNPDDSIVSDSTNNAGCSEIDKNRFYTWVMIQASEKDNRPQLSCTSAY